MRTELYENKPKYKNKYTRGIFLLIGDAFSLLLSAVLVYGLLMPLIAEYKSFPVEHTLITIGSVLAGLMIFRMYMVNWRYTSLNDLGRIILGITLGGGLSFGLSHSLIGMESYEAMFMTLALSNSVLTISGFRISKRMYLGLIKSQNKENRHAIIFGGESEGEQILRDILTNDNWNLTVHGIFDDRVMPGLLLHGVRVMGGKDEMIEYIKTCPVDQLIVAFPQYPKKDLKEIIDKVKTIRPNVDIKVLPSFHSLTDNPVGFEHVREISIEDVLGREPVTIDFQSIKDSITDKTVMVTGGGGSIGSELVRQCANLKPATLIALDIDETELFHIENEFKNTDTHVIPCVASITDSKKIDKVLERYQPEVIFHAAAYKHVPMMESFPGEAIKVNIGGTRLLASLACKHKVDKFIMVSTDKAVNPANVMGATKRVAEEICMAYNGTCITKFISVRFGNVLGSRGSVVPLFIKQIKDGGPVTITDPEMMRYFMTIPEAVLLVMQAGSLGKGGEVFVLDMGEPVKILDMAKELIRLHGLEPYRDIPITITGLRPGEKLFEELLNAEEGVIETEHEEIFKAICSRKLSSSMLEKRIDQLFNLLETDNKDAVRTLLKSIVPTYVYSESEKVKVNGIKKRTNVDDPLIAG